MDRKRTVVEYDEWAVRPEPYDRHGPEDPLRDSAIDFDDEADEDQLPLDVVEAIELGVNLDDPERLGEEEAAREEG